MQESRLIPFTIAGVICFAAAFVLGAGFWFFFGTKAPRFGGENNVTVQTSNQNQAKANQAPEVSEQANSNQISSPTPTPEEIKLAPAGEVAVTGGEVTLGGGDTNLPLRRVSVSDFSMGETEVTNAQYADFVVAAKHRAPAAWKNGKFPVGEDEFPVGGVTWSDANDYCQWLSKQLGATVRLPSEAEWERAARGDNADYKYPWGKQWNDEAVRGSGGADAAKGKTFAVRSATAGRSPFGAYEMVGNVWEWTSDLFVSEFGKPLLYDGKLKERVIKGGSVIDNVPNEKERDKYLSVDARLDRPEQRASDLLGFRYIVVRQPQSDKNELK